MTHRPGYQRRDWQVVDYQEREFGSTGLWFRGPHPDAVHSKEAVTFLGAAQTFGCFCQRPFPALIGDALERPVWNFGYGGAGPRFFLEHPEPIQQANRGAAAVVQVMSGRSEDNSLFRSGGLELLTRRSDGRTIGANEAYRGLLEGFDPFTLRPRSEHLRRLRRLIGRRRLLRLVAETRENWVASYEQLLGSLQVPKVLVWLSTRPPYYDLDLRSLPRFFGAFPQLVNERMVEAIGAYADRSISVVSCAGLPQRLTSRFDGGPVVIDPAADRADLGGRTWTHNHYYPSPEMHRLTADALAPVLAEVIR